MIETHNNEINDKDLARINFHKRIKSIRKPIVKPSRPHGNASYKRERFNWKNEF